jgi:aminomethyltransferase
MNRTPLFDQHVALGARMVPFAGWEMPVQYQGIKEEHLSVRKAVGLFDVSHMGEIRVQGPKSLETLQWLTTNDVATLNQGQAQYSLLPNATGGVVDDLIVYCLKKGEDYLLCVNAANSDKDWQHIQKNNRGAALENQSPQWGQIAVQGPKAPQLLEKLLDLAWDSLPSFNFRPVKFQGQECLVARTGYTGEKGVEVFVPWQKTAALWDALLEAGQEFQVAPIGLGARDTLRTEMKYSLYGQEIDDTTNPYSAGLGWVVKPTAKDFLGKGPIMAAKEKGFSQALVGFELVDKGIARSGYTLVDSKGKFIGRVTSGTYSPSLDRSIGIGYVAKEFSEIGKEIWVDIRGRPVKSTVVKTPFVKAG